MLSHRAPTINPELSLMRPKLPPKVRPSQPDAVSIALKRMHKTVVSEDVPQDFVDLLAAIERKIATDEKQ
jgi:Anti-sigma factor NepR